MTSKQPGLCLFFAPEPCGGSQQGAAEASREHAGWGHAAPGPPLSCLAGMHFGPPVDDLFQRLSPNLA